MKRYDLEEAKTVIRTVAVNEMERSKFIIEREANAAINRLDAEAATIDTLGSPLALYEKATAVFIEMIDLQHRPEFAVYRLSLGTTVGEVYIGDRGGNPMKVPAGKYRALFFLLPVE
jgi:hypothetical protein